MKKYNQLSPEQRYQIQDLLLANETYTSIAAIVGVHKYTLSRELSRDVLKRGRGANEYSPEKAWKRPRSDMKLNLTISEGNGRCLNGSKVFAMSCWLELDPVSDYSVLRYFALS